MEDVSRSVRSLPNDDLHPEFCYETHFCQMSADDIKIVLFTNGMKENLGLQWHIDELRSRYGGIALLLK